MKTLKEEISEYKPNKEDKIRLLEFKKSQLTDDINSNQDKYINKCYRIAKLGLGNHNILFPVIFRRADKIKLWSIAIIKLENHKIKIVEYYDKKIKKLSNEKN